MADYKRAKGWLCAAAGAALLAVSAALPSPASAQDKGQQVSITEFTRIDLKTAPELPAVPRPADLVINRPTMPMADYLAAKNAAVAKPDAARQQPPAPPPATGVTLFTQVGSTNESQTTGGNRFPPGGDIATGADWMVQVNNDIITMYNWNTNAFKQVNLNTLLSSGAFLFDPRVIHDPYWDRFVVLASSCEHCGSTTSNLSFLNLAFSQTNDPTAVCWPAGSCSPRRLPSTGIRASTRTGSGLPTTRSARFSRPG